MAQTFTQKYEDFLDNNHPGGYMSTSINISDSDLDARISQNINNRGFLTSTSHLPWNQIDNKPILFNGDYNNLTNKPTLFNGDYNNLINKPNIPIISISNTLNEGTKLATITINGVDTDIYANIVSEDIPIREEIDPIFSASPANDITYNDINNWNNKSTFSGKYIDLNGAPSLPIDNGSNDDIYTTLNEGTEYEQRLITPLQRVAFSKDFRDLTNTFFTMHFGDFIYKYKNNSWVTFDPNDIDTQEDYELLNNCGFQVGFVKDIDCLYNSNTNDKISLIDQITLLHNAFLSGQICYIKRSNFYYLITEIIPEYYNNTLKGYSIYCTLTNNSNYFTNIFNNSFESDSDILDNLNATQISSTNITIIIDLTHNILYSLPRTIAPVIGNNKSVYVDWKNNGINVRLSSRTGNKLQLITTSGEEGLYSN